MSRDSLGIAMVVASAFPANHGTPGSIRELCQALSRRGHRVHVVTYPMGQPIPVEGVRVWRVGTFLGSRPVTVGPTLDRPLLDLLMVRALVRCVRSERLDVIHGHNYEGALVGWAGRRLTGRPLLYHAVNTMEDELPSYGVIRPRALAVALARGLDRFVPRRADHVACISEDLRRFLEAHGVPSERMSLVPLGVDATMVSGGDGAGLRRRLGIDEGPLVVYTGTLDRFQRVDYLLNAMVLVARRVPAARLLLAVNVAQEAEVKRVRAEAAGLGIAARVSMHPTTLEELPAVLAAADVSVCPRPACPGVPVKLLNAMAAQRPIVTFRGSAKGLVHLESAYLAEDHDWRDIANGITTLLEDPALAGRLGRNARAAITGRLDWPTIVQQIERIYRGLLGGQPRVPAPARTAG